MVANLCRRRTDLVFRWVERNSGLPGSINTSEESAWAGITEEMYATTTSGMEPTGPVGNTTGRSFIPGRSPNGNWARKFSPGYIYRFPVVERVNVLTGIAQFVRPLFSNAMAPPEATTVLVGQ